MVFIIGSAFTFAGVSEHTQIVTRFLLGDGRGEVNRQNLATEQLSKAWDDYSRQRQQRLDYIRNTLRDQLHTSFWRRSIF